MSDLNVGFSKRELKLLASAGFAAALNEHADGWHVFLYDTQATDSDVVAVGTGEVRLDALRDALAQAETIPRCQCGGARSTRWRACVRCGDVLREAQYEAWIKNWAARQRLIVGACARATIEMVGVFPELKRVAGWVSGNETLMTEHWWCVAPDGSVVDPTASQFAGELTYRAFEPGDEVRVGRCMNCGDHIYAKVDRLDDPAHRRSVCSDECQSALEAEYAAEMAELGVRYG